jgi:uncharacterized membrane protein
VRGVGWRKRLSVMRKWLYFYPEPEPMPHTRLFWVAMGLVTVAVATFCTYFILYLVARQHAFLTNAEDLGIMDQAIWSAAHGYGLHQTVCNILHDTNCYSYAGINRFAIHFEPILFPVSWLYLLWPSPNTLLVLQTVVVGLGAYPAFWLARLRLRNELAAVAIAVLYLFYPAQQQATVYDFHAVTFTAALLLFTLYFMYTRRTFWLFVFAILSMACKEEIPLVILMFGLWSALFQQRWRSGLILAAIGLIWFEVVTSFVMPHFSPTGHPLLLARYEGLGQSPSQVVLTIVKHPIFALKQYVLESHHRAYLRILLAPAAYLPLLAPWVLVMALPSVALNLLSANPQMQTGLFQYSAEIVPVLIFSTIEAITLIVWLAQWIIVRVQRVSNVERKQWSADQIVAHSWSAWSVARLARASLLVLLSALVLFKVVQADYFFYGALPFSQNFSWPVASARVAMAQHFVDMVPPNASVSAQTKLVPHLSHRSQIYMFPYGDEMTDYVLLDTAGDVYPFYDTDDYVKEAKSVILGGHYGIVAAQDGFILLKRGLASPGISPFSAVKPNGNPGTMATMNMLDVQPKLPASFCANNYVEARAVAPAMHVTFSGFGGSMDLVNFKVDASDPLSISKNYMSVDTFWQVNKPVTTPLQILLLIDGSDGREYLASTDFPTVLWCQTNTWKPGTIVEVSSRVFGLQGSNVPNGLVHMSMALLPLVQSSSTIMSVHARLPLHIVNAPSTVRLDQGMNALQLAQLRLVP